MTAAAVPTAPTDTDPAGTLGRVSVRCRLAAMTQRGASAVEYGLLLAGIAALIVVAVYLFGGSVLGLFSDTCKGLASAKGSGTCS